MSAEVYNPNSIWFDEGPSDLPPVEGGAGITPETPVADEYGPVSEGKPTTDGWLSEMNDALAARTPSVEEFGGLLDGNYHERFRVNQGSGVDVAFNTPLDPYAVDVFNRLANPYNRLLSEAQVAHRKKVTEFDVLFDDPERAVFDRLPIEKVARFKSTMPEADNVELALELVADTQRELKLDAALREWGYDESDLEVAGEATDTLAEANADAADTAPLQITEETQPLTPVADAERDVEKTITITFDPGTAKAFSHSYTVPFPKQPAPAQGEITQVIEPATDVQPAIRRKDILATDDYGTLLAASRRVNATRTVGDLEKVYAENKPGFAPDKNLNIAAVSPAEQAVDDSEKVGRIRKLGKVATYLQAKVNLTINKVLSTPSELREQFSSADKRARIGMVSRGVGYVCLGLGGYFATAKGLDALGLAGDHASHAASMTTNGQRGVPVFNGPSVVASPERTTEVTQVMTVRPGDTVWDRMSDIVGAKNSREALIGTNEMARLNPGVNLNNIHAGQQLVAPTEQVFRELIEQADKAKK